MSKCVYACGVCVDECVCVYSVCVNVGVCVFMDGILY